MLIDLPSCRPVLAPHVAGNGPGPGRLVKRSPILLIYLAAMPLARVAPPPGVQLNYVAVMVSAIAFTLFANYSLERSKRTNYLYEVRARIQRAELVELSRLDTLTSIHNRRALDGGRHGT